MEEYCGCVGSYFVGRRAMVFLLAGAATKRVELDCCLQQVLLAIGYKSLQQSMNSYILYPVYSMLVLF